jgi:hypothetical protein
MGGQTMKVLVDQWEEFGLCVRTTPPEFTEQSCYFPRRRLHGYFPPEPRGQEVTSVPEFLQRKFL